MRLKNKVIVITGGSGLLGRAIISHIKSEGGTAINADISVETNLDVGSVNTDICSEKSVDDLIALISECYGQIDGWVNNAYPRTKDWGAKLEDVIFESWKENINMQLNSYFLCCKKALEHMKRNGSGSIVNMASIYGVVGPDFSIYEGTTLTNPVGYSAIKGGLINLTRYLASYIGSYGIRVNCVSPGGIFDNQHPVFVENYERKVPLKRMGSPEDIAPAVTFLLSDESSYITGHNLMVDGGWSVI